MHVYVCVCPYIITTTTHSYLARLPSCFACNIYIWNACCGGIYGDHNALKFVARSNLFESLYLFFFLNQLMQTLKTQHSYQYFRT